MYVSWCAYMACVSAHDYQPGWYKDGDNWLYRKADGSYAADEWIHDGGRWYVFDGAGHMIRGWFKSGDDWYYMADDGGMCASQWVYKGDYAYYLTASGAMARNAYVRSKKPITPGGYIYYWVNSDGKYEKKWDTVFPDLEKYEEAF